MNIKWIKEQASGYLFFEDVSNTDELSHYLLVNEFRDIWFVNIFLESQKNDGGFGFSKGYASDIIDTNCIKNHLFLVTVQLAELLPICNEKIRKNIDIIPLT